MTKPNGVVLYEGPSKLDGGPVVVIATGLSVPSENSKTGPVVQFWILRKDRDPWQALKSGKDASICGDCPLRGDKGTGRACYVNVTKAVTTIYDAFRRGSYPRVKLDEARALFAGKVLRFGAYGDPAALPASFWQAVAEGSRGWTSYSHAHRRFRSLRRYAMASVESAVERAAAKRRGFRTFRVSVDGVPGSGEIVCPASEEAGRRTTCERCRLCDGSRGSDDPRPDIVIRVHGRGRSSFLV